MFGWLCLFLGKKTNTIIIGGIGGAKSLFEIQYKIQVRLRFGSGTRERASAYMVFVMVQVRMLAAT